MTRATIRTAIDEPTAAQQGAGAEDHEDYHDDLSLPIMSPRRPRIGVATEADSRYAVNTQVTAAWLVCRLAWIVGSTGRTRDWSSANASTATKITANVAR
jgi:hypothetical protein